MKTIKRALAVQLTFLLLLFSFAHAESQGDAGFDYKRNRLIGFILAKQLPALLFSDKKVDDQLADAAFKLYIKQLDYQKRFLLMSDVKQLEAFAPYIDDNLLHGKITLPDAGFDILNEKIDIIEKYIDSLFVSNAVRREKAADGADELWVGAFDIDRKESYETDPEKLNFAADLTGLKDRWRLIIKAQVISQYLDLVDDQTKKAAEAKEKKDGGLAAARTEDQLWQDAVAKVAKRNKNFFQRLHKDTLQDHYDRFFDCIARAFDPHTNYNPPAVKEQFDIEMRGSLEGIGAILQEDDGYIKVVRIIPGSASARQGQLKAEDIILQVAQENEEPADVTDMRLRDAVRLIRGPKGEAVTLTVKKPDNTTAVIKIVRDVVQIEETFVRSTTFQARDGKKIGYIFIPSFYRDFSGDRNENSGRNSTDDTRRAIEELKKEKVAGIIVDLRDDGGGALFDAVDIAGLFVKTGPVVQVKDNSKHVRVVNDPDEGIDYDGPMVMMVNQFSASASEIVAAAMQDYRRAVIVGSKTYGKGTVQSLINLNQNLPLLQLGKDEDLGALKVTIQKFYRINGNSTQYNGVTPDIVLPNLFEHIKSGERYLDYSLPSDSIPPAQYNAWEHAPSVEQLKKRSEERVARDEGLKIIATEAAIAGKRADDTTVVVTLADMRRKRVETKEMKERIGAHYRKYRDDQEDADDSGQTGKGNEDPVEVWKKDIQEDPYVHEAVNIVDDIIKFS